MTNVAAQDEGKLVWKVDWPMRWTFEGVHFEPGGPWTTRAPGRRTRWARRSSARSIERLRAERSSATRSSASPACRRCRRRRAACRPPSRGAADPRGADPALALRPPPAEAGVQRRLRPGGPAPVRRVGRPHEEGRDPGEARRGRAGVGAGLGDVERRHAADPRGRRTVPDAVVGRRRHRRLPRDHRPHGRRERGRPGASAHQGRDLDRVLCRPRGPHDGPRVGGHRAPGRAGRGRGAVAAPAARPAARLVRRQRRARPR